MLLFAPEPLRELRTALMIERSALLRTIQPLTRDELIRTAREAATGARHFVCHLTEVGETRYGQARPLWLAAQRAFDVLVGQLFSAAMRGQLSGLANALVSNDPSGSAGIQAG